MDTEWIVRAAVIGIGGTVAMDLWAKFIRAAYGAQSLDYGLLGRWVSHLLRGQLRHAAIAQTPPVRLERVIGWTAHYAIGVGFAGLLLAVAGLDWSQRPTLGPVLGIAWATLAAPWFVMQPAMGLGIAGSKTPSPRAARLKSFATHTVYGLGVYLTALATAGLGQ